MDFEEHLGNLSYLTKKNYISQINNFLKRKEPLDNLKYYLQESPTPLRKVAIVKYLFYLKEVGQDIEGILAEIKGIKAKQTPRKESQTLLMKDGNRLIRHLLEKKKYELAIICMIAYDTGARIRAILKLRKRDIIIKEADVYLTFSEKRGKILERLITKETHRWVERIFNNAKDDEYLFFKQERIDNESLDEKYYLSWSELKNISRKIFGKGISFHWLRRGSGNFIYDRTDKNIVATAEFLAHDSTKTTQDYLRIQAQVAEKVIKRTRRKW